MNNRTVRLLEKARQAESKQGAAKPRSYVEGMTEADRAVAVRAAARRAIRCHKRAIELLADL
ncbi:hypothetical protein CTM95_20420 [Photobacterium angustum]|nr:hypothetical protein CTM95_20420 [Photobacterium angustum]